MSDFDRDNAWQKGVRDRILLPGFYDRYATEGRYVVMDKGRIATLIQKRFAADTVVQSKDGAAVFIEEKIVRWPCEKNTAGEWVPKANGYSAYCLETESCTKPGHYSLGWMAYGEADYLLYCFANKDEAELDCHLLDFPALQKWFWGADDADMFGLGKKQSKLPRFGPLKTLNASAGCVVGFGLVDQFLVKHFSIIAEARAA